MTEWSFAREPSAELRTGARQLHELFVALREAGFTESQALIMVAAVVSGGAGKSS